MLSKKHNSTVNHNIFDAKSFECQTCKKLYKHASTLSSHKNICKIPEEVFLPIQHSESDIKILTNLVLELVKSNTDLQKQVLEICKNDKSMI